MRTPAADGLFMPAEWTPHARTWMAWPCRESLWREHLGAVREEYAHLARLISAFEPVAMVADPALAREASALCGPAVQIVPLPQDDSWARDTAPTFVTDGRGGVAGVAWRFNGWGGIEPTWKEDARMAEAILSRLSMRAYKAPIVFEGGSVHVDGEGTALVSEQCLLNPNRNPGLSRAEIEETLRAYLGVRVVVWLGEGLENDETSGHVDNLACFARPGVVIALACSDPSDPNHRVLGDNLRRLALARDARGRPLTVVTLEQPAPRTDHLGGRMPLSYVNFSFVNGGVVLPAFEDPKDAPARETLARLFPNRRVLQAPSLRIALGGGSVHCVTQQQPAGVPLAP